MTIKWILFDLGGVLYDIDVHSPIAMLKSMARNSTDGFTEDLVIKKHKEFMKGEYSPEMFFRELKQLLGINAEEEQIRAVWNKIIVKFREEFKPLLIDLKSNFNLALVSNTDPSHMELVFQQIPEFPYFFHKLFLSYDIKEIKPNLNYFKFVLRDIKELPENCLYFDDSPENIESASSLGIQSFLVSSFSEVVEIIARMKLI